MKDKEVEKPVSSEDPTPARPLRVQELPTMGDSPGLLGYCRPRVINGHWYYTRKTLSASRRIRWYSIGYCQQGCSGHASPEMARNHFRNYLLHEQVKLNLGGAQRGGKTVFALCDCCLKGMKHPRIWGWLSRSLPEGLARRVQRRWGKFADRCAVVAGEGAWTWPLCPKHMTREGVDEMLPMDCGENIGFTDKE